MYSHPRRSLRGLLQAAFAAGCLATFSLPSSASTPAFPAGGKPVRIVVPAPAGGPGDLVGRTLGQQLSKQLAGVSVIVDNKPGGASILAANDVRRAEPDGHTLLLALNTTHTQIPHLYAKPPFDPFNDFTPIARVYQAQSVLVAHPSLPANTLAKAVELSRQTSVPVGSASSGSNSHLYIEILNSDYGANFVHVPYKGAADAVRDLLGGFTMMQFDSPSSSLPHIQAGKLKPLAVTGDTRMPFLPDVPTGPEQGFPNLNIGTWMAVFGPPGMQPEVVARVNDEIVKALQTAEVKGQLEPLGLTVAPTTADELAELVRHDYDMWGRIINQLGLRLD